MNALILLCGLMVGALPLLSGLYSTKENIQKWHQLVEIRHMEESIGVLVGDATLCRKAFHLVSGLTSGSQVEIRYPGTSTALYRKDVVLNRNPKVSIGSITLENVGVVETTAAATIYEASIQVQLLNESSSISRKPREFPIFIQIRNATPNVVELCYASNSAPALCRELGGTFNANETPPCLIKTIIEKKSCGENQFINGISSQGELKCSQ